MIHCVKGVRIRSFSGPYFPAFKLNPERLESNWKQRDTPLSPYADRMRENTDQKNSGYGQFSRSDSLKDVLSVAAFQEIKLWS